MSHIPGNLFPALALLAAGALAGSTLGGGGSVQADATGEQRNSNMEVVVSPKTNEPMVFIFDEESKRLLVYTTVNGRELSLAAVRNTSFDTRIVEYRNQSENGMSVRDLKKAFDEEDAAARRKAEEEAKKAAKAAKPAG